MNDLSPARHIAAPRRYASPLIAKRRARILAETKRLIGEDGIDGFTLRDIGQAAGVSVTTIYNIFGDKEGVIAHALREFHSGIRLNLPSSGLNFQGVCRAIADTTEIVIANRAYALALAELYFSSSLPETLFDVIRGMPLQIFSHWLWLARRDGTLLGSIAEADAETMFANLEWSSIKDWGAGRLDTERLAATRQRSFLAIAVALCTPDAAAEAGALLAQLHGEATAPRARAAKSL